MYPRNRCGWDDFSFHAMLFKLIFSSNRPLPQFLHNQKQISMYTTQAGVEGVYEMHIPLVWRAVMELGCVASVDPKVTSGVGVLFFFSCSLATRG
jgi:hypothetical protein